MIWGIDLGVRSIHISGLGRAKGEIELASVTQPRGHPRYMEIRWIAKSLSGLIHPSDDVFVEEPPLAGRKNIRVFLGLSETCGAVMAASPCAVTPVPVATWKKRVIGSGSANKDAVRSWLDDNHRDYAARCGGDQNLVDATCIALYGVSVLEC